MHLTLLGGAESAGFARGLADLLDDGDHLSIVFNTARDMWAHGLKRSPDADALVAAFDTSPPRPRSYGVAEEVCGLGVEPLWVRDSDQDIALQLIRTQLMQAGFSLTDVTAALTSRRSISTTLLPMSDERVEQHVVIDDLEGNRAVHVEEYLANHIGRPAHELVLVAEDWKASGAALDAIESADVIVFGPASLSLTLMPLLRTPDLVEAIAASTAPVVDVHVRDLAPEALAAHAHDVELLFDFVVKGEPDPAAVLATARGLL